MALTGPERETVVTLSDADDVAHVYTAQRRVITKLKRNPAATLTDEGRFEGTAWARFEIPAGLVSFRSKAVKREPTERQRAALAKARARTAATP